MREHDDLPVSPRSAAERGNDIDVRPGRHQADHPLARRIAVTVAAVALATGSAAAAAGSTADAPVEATHQQRIAAVIVAEATGTDRDWDSVPAMESILPVETIAAGPVREKAPAEAVPGLVEDAAPVGGLDAAQMANAVAIIEAGMERGLSERAWAVALATAMQESKLRNYANVNVPESYDYDHQAEGSDHDSVGLFQQRPSMGWGTVGELMDVRASADKFYGTLEKVSGWESMPIAAAAQAVQISAYPDHYAQWEDLAWRVIDRAVR